MTVLISFTSNIILTRSEGVSAAIAEEAPRASKVREMFLINIVGLFLVA